MSRAFRARLIRNKCRHPPIPQLSNPQIPQSAFRISPNSAFRNPQSAISSYALTNRLPLMPVHFRRSTNLQICNSAFRNPAFRNFLIPPYRDPQFPHSAFRNSHSAIPLLWTDRAGHRQRRWSDARRSSKRGTVDGQLTDGGEGIGGGVSL